MKTCIAAIVISKNIPPAQHHSKVDSAVQTYSTAIT